MKKKILLFIMVFVVLFTITACGSKKEEEKKETITPLLYKVTKDGSSNTIYILGTIHVGNLKNTEFAEYVLKAFDESHYVSAEIDNEESDDLISELEKMSYPEGDSIKKHMSEESYNKLMKFVDENALDMGIIDKDSLNLQYYSQVLVQTITEKSGLSTDDGIDDYFVNKAKKEGKEFMEVESIKFQENVLASLPDKFYENTIVESIDNFDEEVKNIKEAFETWKKGDEEEIWKDDGASLKEEDKAKYSAEDIKAAEEFDEKILYARNVTMTDKLEEFFKKNYDMFFMVGQDHVIGPKGIVSYLRQRGYTVEKVS
jgi:hypothetical protein